jgi:hypothetical protein
MIAHSLRLVAALSLLVLFGLPAALAGEGRGLIVAELFTSQGCNACPPADEYLAELNARPDVLGLSFHVNYWDYLGWKDTFATEWTTERQYQYKKALGERSVYTPQLVIGGSDRLVGSRRDAVVAALDAAMEPTIGVTAVRRGEGRIAIAVAPGESNKGAADVWLVLFFSQRTVEIERGENAGDTAVFTNVVSDYQKVGEWYGEALEIELQVGDMREGGHDRGAIIVQGPNGGAIIGALELDLNRL